jgi:3-deoxy-D-arabino-heptulosonate 7-phosphate (DAHP) synthase
MNKNKKAPQFSIATIVGNETTKKQLRGYIEEIVGHKNAIKNAMTDIKLIKDTAKDTLGIPGKTLGQMVKEYLDDGVLDDQIEQLEEAKTLTDGVFKV